MRLATLTSVALLLSGGFAIAQNEYNDLRVARALCLMMINVRRYGRWRPRTGRPYPRTA